MTARTFTGDHVVDTFEPGDEAPDGCTGSPWCECWTCGHFAPEPDEMEDR